MLMRHLAEHLFHGQGMTAWAVDLVPNNHQGGLYASDLFLEKTIPEIMASPAFQHDGEIQIIFDEAFPRTRCTATPSPTTPATPQPPA
jgi:hypothetical protein